jgi:hypothetical protein
VNNRDKTSPSFPRSFIHSFIHSLTHSLTHPFIHSSIHPLTHSLTYSFTHSFTHSLLSSFIHPFIHPFIHSSIHSPGQKRLPLLTSSHSIPPSMEVLFSIHDSIDRQTTTNGSATRDRRQSARRNCSKVMRTRKRRKKRKKSYCKCVFDCIQNFVQQLHIQWIVAIPSSQCWKDHIHTYNEKKSVQWETKLRCQMVSTFWRVSIEFRWSAVDLR